MKTKLKNVNIYFGDAFIKTPYFKALLSSLDADKEYHIFPGFCDVHVHFREPGFSYKETILSGSLAAARGGYTDVCAMPNLSPVPDCAENLKIEQAIIDKGAVINVHPYASVTVAEKGETLSDMQALAENCVAFSDDGKGIQSDALMREAMLKAKSLGKIIAAHCEDNSLLFGGYIHKGEYAFKNNHKGICSESEWKPIERDLKLAKETGASYHVCHISTKESVALIRKSKAEGVDVTCETAPHYLLLSDKDIKESGDFKMNPPLRSEEDRLALIGGVLDGTVDMIATDHAPHSMEEKSKGLKDSPFGIVGLECAFPLLYTELVKKGIIPLAKLLDMMIFAPRARFGITQSGYTVWELDKKTAVDTEKFLSKGRSTPFKDKEIYGECKYTVLGEKTVYENKSEANNG